MNKLIKIITSITCSIGLIGGTSIVSACKNTGPSYKIVPLPDTAYSLSEDKTELQGFSTDFLQKKDLYESKGYNTILIPSSVSTIKKWAFYDAQFDKTLIPDFLIALDFSESQTTSIDSLAFRCNALQFITFNKYLSSIEGSAFGISKNIKNISIPDENLKYGLVKLGKGGALVEKNEGKAEWTNETKSITGLAYGDIVIPEGIETIAYNAFFGSSITSLSIPSTVIKIGDGVCDSDSALLSIDLYSTNLEIIGFGNLENIEKIVWHSISNLNNLTIFPNTFVGCNQNNGGHIFSFGGIGSNEMLEYLQTDGALPQNWDAK